MVARNGRRVGDPAQLLERDDQLDRRHAHAAVVGRHGQARPVELDERLPQRAAAASSPPTTDAHERRRALALGDVAHDALQLELLVVELEVHVGSPRLRSRGTAAGRCWPAARASVNERSSAVSAKSSVASTARSRCMLRMRLVSSVARWGSLAILLGAGQRLVEHLVVGAHVVDEADLGGPLRRDAVAGERVLLGQLQAGEQRPRDRAAVGGDQADEHVGVGEVGALGHEHDVGQRDEAAAEPDGRPVHRGDRPARGRPPCR